MAERTGPGGSRVPPRSSTPSPRSSCATGRPRPAWPRPRGSTGSSQKRRNTGEHHARPAVQRPRCHTRRLGPDPPNPRGGPAVLDLHGPRRRPAPPHPAGGGVAGRSALLLHGRRRAEGRQPACPPARAAADRLPPLGRGARRGGRGRRRPGDRRRPAHPARAGLGRKMGRAMAVPGPRRRLRATRRQGGGGAGVRGPAGQGPHVRQGPLRPDTPPLPLVRWPSHTCGRTKLDTLLPGITAERVPTSRLTVNVLSVAGRDGSAENTPVLFVHGNVSSSLFWQPMMLALPETFRPLAIDLRDTANT